jgi:hypothetical protein
MANQINIPRQRKSLSLFGQWTPNPFLSLVSIFRAENSDCAANTNSRSLAQINQCLSTENPFKVDENGRKGDTKVVRERLRELAVRIVILEGIIDGPAELSQHQQKVNGARVSLIP